MKKHIATNIQAFLNEHYHHNNDIEFKDWFKHSVMIDSNGMPIIFYHGTNKEFEVFDKNMIGKSTDAGQLGYGFYFYTDYYEASQYGKVRSFYLNIENPYYATDEDNEMLAELNNIKASKEFTNNLISEGYDGVYYNGNLRGETVVFDANQIQEIKDNNDVFENRFEKRNDEKYKNCYISDLTRMEIIEDFLNEVELNPDYNKEDPNYFKLIDDQDGYDDQTYIQNINENEFILQEGQVDSCQEGLYSKPEYEGLSKSECIKKVIKDRFPRIAEEFGCIIKNFEVFKYKGKFIMKIYFVKKNVNI